MSKIKMPEPGISLYVQCANGMQMPVLSYSKEQVEAYAQARVDEFRETVYSIIKQHSKCEAWEIEEELRALQGEVR